MATTKKKSPRSGKAPRPVLLANKSYGLYIGEVVDDGELAPDGTRTIRATNVRHVAHWRGKTGGITSLAAHGPCGPNAKLSRIGAPAPAALLSGIVNVFDLTPEAVSAFAGIAATDA